MRKFSILHIESIYNIYNFKINSKSFFLFVFWLIALIDSKTYSIKSVLVFKKISICLIQGNLIWDILWKIGYGSPWGTIGWWHWVVCYSDAHTYYHYGGKVTKQLQDRSTTVKVIRGKKVSTNDTDNLIRSLKKVVLL